MSPGSGEAKERGLLGEGVQTVGEHSGVGEAEVVRLAEDDVVEHPDAEDLRCFDQTIRAFPVFPGWSRVARRVLC